MPEDAYHGFMQTLFQQMAAYGDARYDPEMQLIRVPGSRNVHTEYLEAGDRHVTRESLSYALVLLERDRDGDVTRAQQILEKMSTLQGNRPQHPRDGLWHYFADQSVMDWPFPDFNWADFNGMTLLMIWHMKRHLLDETTQLRMREMIRRAALCIQNRNVTMAYTNIAIKGTFVTLAAAELLGDPSLMEYATDRARRLHKEIFRTGSFTEYNSPTYAAVSIAGLMAIDTFVNHEASKKLAAEIQHLFWRHVSSHFHVPTGELAGPHSRAYSIRLHDSPYLLGVMLAKASNGSANFNLGDNPTAGGFEPFYGYFLKPNVPPDALQLLLDHQRVTTMEEITDARDMIYSWWRPIPQPDQRDGSLPVPTPIPTRITTHLNPAFCLGSVNLMDGWEQRQNLIAYWNNGGPKPSYFRHSYLHDDRPCCSGYLASAQRDGCVLAASFLVQYCDHHPSIPADEISAEFLGTTLEINNEGNAFQIWKDDQSLMPPSTTAWHAGEHLWLRFSTLWMALRLLRHEATPASNITPKLNFNGSRLDVRLPHYQGARKRLRWSDLESTHTSYAVWITPPQSDWDQWRESIRRQSATSTVQSSDVVEVKLNDMQLSVPGRTLPREQLPSIVSV